jgi:hypothetical protein
MIKYTKMQVLKNFKTIYAHYVYASASLVYFNYESVLVFIGKKSFCTSTVKPDNELGLLSGTRNFTDGSLTEESGLSGDYVAGFVDAVPRGPGGPHSGRVVFLYLLMKGDILNLKLLYPLGLLRKLIR